MNSIICKFRAKGCNFFEVLNDASNSSQDKQVQKICVNLPLQFMTYKYFIYRLIVVLRLSLYD